MATSTAQEYETQTDKTEPADYFSDEDDLKEKGISLPPTREDVQKLLEVYDGKYAEELCFIRANYDAKKDQRQKSLKIKYKETETIMFKEFHLYKLKSTKGQPFTNSRGHYLGHIPGDKETQTRRADKIRKQIKRRLESDPLLNIAAAHVVVAPAINYGNEDDEAAAGSSGTAVSQTPNTRIQQKLTDLWSTPASDQGYGSMLVTPTYVQNGKQLLYILQLNSSLYGQL